jgi:ribosomal protein L37AE/L43A
MAKESYDEHCSKKHDCIFCEMNGIKNSNTELHLGLWMCRRCKAKVAEGFERG